MAFSLKNFGDKAGQATKAFLGLDRVHTTSLSSSSYRGGNSPFSNSGWFFENSGAGPDIHFSYNGLNDIIAAYEQCAPVYSIVNKQSMAYINGRTKILNVTGRKKGEEASSEWANQVKTILARPNPIQNGRQFKAQIAIYMRLFGYCVILPIKKAGFPNAEAEELWIIPPYLCKFNLSKKAYFNLKNGWIESVEVKYGNEKTTFFPNQLIILRDITPGFDNIVLPGSPIKPLQQNISNLIGLYNSKGVLINYRGALGILSPEIDPAGAIGVDPKEQEALEIKLMNYGLRSHQTKFIIANSAMQWQQMGVPYRDLMLTEWAEDDTMVISDGLNFPFRLLASTKTSSMNGTEVESYKKILYQDFVLPFSEMINDQWNEVFDAVGNNALIFDDYSHVAVLQEDAVKKATARLILNQAMKIEYDNGLKTRSEWSVKLGDEPLPDEIGNVRSTDINPNIPLATIIGVGGIQGVIAVLTAAGIGREARIATLTTLFPITEAQATAMVVEEEPKEETGTTEENATPPPAG